MQKVARYISSHPRWFALFAGAVSATGFAPLNLWPVTLICLALLIALLLVAPERNKALAIGWAFGFGQMTVGLFWLAHAFTFQDKMPVELGWFASPLISLYLAIYPAMAAGLAWRWGRSHAARFVHIFAASWIVTEYLRAKVFTGFPWNPLSVSFVDIAQVTELVGTYGASGIVVLAAGGLFLAVKRRFAQAALCAAIPAFAVVYAMAAATVAQPSGRGPMLHIVQPNIGQQDKYRPGYARENFRKLAVLTRAGSTDRKRVIFWPEAAIPDHIGEDDYEALLARQNIASLIQPGDILLTGADKIFSQSKRVGNYIETSWIGAANSNFALDSKGEILWRYDKAHLVPFGEYLPMRELLKPIGLARLVPGDLDFWPGPGPQTHAVAGIGKVGPQICYEIIFSGEVTDRSSRPDIIFNPSNDAWYGSWQPPQHLAQARLRAMEEGLPIIRSTPTGISAVIDANGKIVKALGFQRPGYIQAELPMAKPATLFSRYGNILSIAFALLLVALALLPLAHRQTSR